MLPYRPLKDDEKVALWLLAIGHTREEIAELVSHQFSITLRQAKRRIDDASEKIGALNQKDTVSKAIALDVVPVQKVRSYFMISPSLPEAKGDAVEVAERRPSQVTEDSLNIEPPRLLHVPSSFEYYPPDTHAFDVDLTQAWKHFGYLPTVAMEYERRLASIYQFDDDRILYKKELGVHTLPYELYEQRLLPTIEEGGEKARVAYLMLMCTKLSQNAFHEQVPRGCSFKDLGSMRTIRQALTQCIPPRDEWLLNLGAQPLGRDDVLYQLLTVVSYLNKYRNYELALVDDFKYEHMEEGSWAVKGTRAIYLEDWEHDEQERKTKTHFDSTDVVEIRRHQDFFHTLWNDKAKVMSDRRDVTEFILQEIIKALVLATTEQ